jgi:enoyl-CoA hydratase
MGTAVTYERSGAFATITMDDGKANALSVHMFEEINAAFDEAEADGVVVVLAGRSGILSGGFDLEVLLSGSPDAVPMLLAGFELAHRMLSFSRPIVIACTGHAVAMGAFLLLSGDYRVGVADAAHRITANEVAIGLTVPHAALEVCRATLTPAAFHRAVNLSEVFTPASAVPAGFLDQLVPGTDLLERAQAQAHAFAELKMDAYEATKLRSRAATLANLRTAIELDSAEFRTIFG